MATLTDESFKFLAQLKRHNDRDWFNERKEQYKKIVEQPMIDLVHEVAAEFRRLGIPLYAKEKAPVMRVYRDIRFSKDKTPYKAHVSAELRRSFASANGMFYLHFSPSESFIAAGVWQPDRPLLHAWREAIAADPARFAKVVAALKKKDLQISLEHSLQTMPRGFQQYGEKPFAQWLKLSSFVTSRQLTKEETLIGITKKVVDFGVAVKPLLEFGWSLEKDVNNK